MSILQQDSSRPFLNETVQETDWNLMTMDIRVIMISVEKKMEILEENVE